MTDAPWFVRLQEAGGVDPQLYACRKGDVVIVAAPRGIAFACCFDDEGENVATRVAGAAEVAAATPVSLLTASEVELHRVALDRSGRFRLLLGGACVAVVLAVPSLSLAGQQVAPEALCVKTVLTRCMGPLEDWVDIFSQLGGYNAVHLTPVQQLDGSAYCIRDHFEPAASMGARPVSWDKFAAALRAIREERKLLFFSDLVWNHMSSAAPFLRQHPEAGFSVTLDEARLGECNAPHLAPALALDVALQGVATVALGSEADVVSLLEHVSTVVWQAVRLWEYLVVDVEEAVAAFVPAAVRAAGSFDELLERFKREGLSCSRAGARLAWKARSPSTLFVDKDEFRKCVETYNLHKYRELAADKEAVLINLGHRLRYLRSTGSTLLFEPFFALVDPAKGIYCACNGWTVDNKQDDSIYLRRELIVWSDLVKLRFGDAPAASPALWKLMEQYTERTAELFDGIRVDNAHTTPLHVAKHMIAVARRVRPDVYVVAELFADADSKKLAYMRETGVHAVILEAMRAWEPFELTRLMHMCGGRPVGSVAADYPLRSLEALSHPPAMFMDCSHDNRTPAEERHVTDTLSNGACVWSTHTSVGSTWGADELVPVNISVAKETRPYPKGPRGGTTRAKAALGELHQRLGGGGFSEFFVESLDRGLVVAQRSNPETHETAYFLIRTAFSGSAAEKDGALFGHTLRTRDARLELACCFALVPAGTTPAPAPAPYVAHPEYINSLAGYELRSEPARMCKVEQRSNNEWTVELLSFPPGSVVCARGFPAEVSLRARQELYSALLPSCAAALAHVSLADLNIILYRCAPEERSTTDTGAYNFPGWKATTYCGLAGVHQLMLDARGDLGSPLYQHLREGNWLMSYCWERLERHAGVAPAVADLARWLRRADDLCGAQPRHLVPK